MNQNNYSYSISVCMHTVIWFQVTISKQLWLQVTILNTHILHTFKWFQLFLSYNNAFQNYLFEVFMFTEPKQVLPLRFIEGLEVMVMNGYYPNPITGPSSPDAV